MTLTNWPVGQLTLGHSLPSQSLKLASMTSKLYWTQSYRILLLLCTRDIYFIGWGADSKSYFWNNKITCECRKSSNSIKSDGSLICTDSKVSSDPRNRGRATFTPSISQLCYFYSEGGPFPEPARYTSLVFFIALCPSFFFPPTDPLFHVPVVSWEITKKIPTSRRCFTTEPIISSGVHNRLPSSWFMINDYAIFSV